jgi:uncharacterized protein YdiU (UPF0061 family)
MNPLAATMATVTGRPWWDVASTQQILPAASVRTPVPAVETLDSVKPMSVDAPTLFVFENTFARHLAGLFEPWSPEPVPAPTLLAVNEPLAVELGLDPAALASDAGVAVLAGNSVPPGSEPLAQAYAGHQFGGYSPRLGDGRALLLGEVIDTAGRRRDVHLKGSGRTPFARGGDGKAAVGPMLREYIVGEAMHGLGIPTTRALAVVATGERVARETPLPGAVLTRIASSHLRVGTFQYAAAQGDMALLRRLTDYAILRHFPHLEGGSDPGLALLGEVIRVQASLVARWMNVGFVHGVMNTDNVTISGETIDYGPCAFMEAFDPATVFSSIDHGGRYAYGNQPAIAQWNLARLAEALLPMIHDDTELAVARATDTLHGFVEHFNHAWLVGMRAKLGLRGADETDRQLVESLFDVMRAGRVDFTTLFRRLSTAVAGSDHQVTELFDNPGAMVEWLARWRERLDATPGTAEAMDAVNPLYIARNHKVEEALASASADADLRPMQRLVELLRDPFVERPGAQEYTMAAPVEFGRYRTFCGT